MPALVSSPSHAHVANIANDTQCLVPDAAPEAKIETSASEPAGAGEGETASGDVAANVDQATEEPPIADGDTKPSPVDANTSPDISQSAQKAAEETTSPEGASSSEDKQCKEADFPPIDPAAGSDTPAAEGGSTDLAVSR